MIPYIISFHEDTSLNLPCQLLFYRICAFISTSSGLAGMSVAKAPPFLSFIYHHQVRYGKLTNDGTFQYAYDAENHLMSATPMETASGLKKLGFDYDYKSRRTGKKVYSYIAETWEPDTDSSQVLINDIGCPVTKLSFPRRRESMCAGTPRTLTCHHRQS
ncbi:MAG: hypothetical protein GY801_14105 [bacterium]|nr:hypothetical protein [bacterium]